MGEFGRKLVAKPSDGRKRISFVEQAGENGHGDDHDDNAVAENDDDDDVKTTSHSKRDVLNSLRASTCTINLTEDEVDRIFDDVFATPQERARQVTLAEISAKHDYSWNTESADTGYTTRRFKRYPSSAIIVRAVVATLVLILIGWISWEIGRVQAPNINDSAEDVSGSVLANQTNDNDSNQLGDETDVVVVTTNPPQRGPVVNVDAEKLFSRNGDVSEPNAIPGKDIGTYLIGFVEEPVDPAEIQVLLKHDLTKDLRVIDNEAATFDTSETVRVKVDNYDLQCGVKVDQVPLTLICSFNELCGVYFVDASYCDKYE